MYIYKIPYFYVNIHFYVYFNWNKTFESRLYLSSYDIHDLKINNGLNWTYISTLE